MDYRNFVCDRCNISSGWYETPCIYCVNNPNSEEEIKTKTYIREELKKENYFHDTKKQTINI